MIASPLAGVSGGSGPGPKGLTYVAPHVQAYDAAVQAGRVPSHAGRKLRVGFISMFFREHASGKMIQGIIEGISRSKFHVTVFCIKGALDGRAAGAGVVAALLTRGHTELRDVQPYTGTVADRIRNSADKYIELRKEYGLEQMRLAIEVG